MSAGSDQTAEKMNIGVAYSTLAQLDTHNNDYMLQRISAQVTEPCTEVDNMIKTDIPKLRR